MNITLKNTVLVVILGIIAGQIQAQQPDSIAKFQDESSNLKMETLVERTDGELDYSDFLDDLGRLKRHPINLNAATDDDLRNLSFLNELQIANLRAYIMQYGSIASIYELQMIEGFSQEMIELMLPFITLTAQSEKDKITLKRLLHYGKADILLRYQQLLEQQKGYLPASDSGLLLNPNARYLGNQGRLFTRFKYAYSDRLQFGFTGEKDPGETFFPSNDTLKKGFDFFSTHAFYQGPGLVRQVAVGDYQVQFGQGLTLWSGLSFGKLPGEVGGKKAGMGIKPSTSSNENLFMRGAATTLASGKFGLTLFYSTHKVDANLVQGDTLSASDTYLTSLQESGYHRTPGELADKDASTIKAGGGHLTYQTGTLRLGATAWQQKLDAILQKPSTPEYLFYVTKKTSVYTGIDYDYLYKKLNLYGEFARGDNGAVAYVGGISFAADPRFLISSTYRNYPRDYVNLISSAFAENSSPMNETGLYTGFVASLASKWTLTAYVDQYRFGWLRYRVEAPSRGEEYSAQLNWQASRSSEISLRFREQHKQLNSTENMYLNTIQTNDKRNIRLQVSINPLPYLSLKSRIEYSEYRDSKGISKGYLLYQDVGFRPEKSKLSLVFRFALFDAPDYNSRLYAYENDVLYAFTSTAFNGIGSRFYIVAAWKLNRHAEIWAKYSRAYYSDRQIIGSGLDEIDGNTRSEIKVQLRLAL
ncbi:MAG: helix-hairpin-helix domain-containing protein [Bacteroidales bacterium]